MKKASGHILCTLLLVAYVFGYMGFGIHTCHDDGSRHFVWMLGDVSCEAIHHHSHGEDHDHHHDDHCCSTEVFVLTDAQDNAPHFTDFSAPVTALSLQSETPAFRPSLPGHRTLLLWDAPPPEIPVTQSLLSVWKA